VCNPLAGCTFTSCISLTRKLRSASPSYHHQATVERVIAQLHGNHGTQNNSLRLIVFISLSRILSQLCTFAALGTKVEKGKESREIDSAVLSEIVYTLYLTKLHPQTPNPYAPSPEYSAPLIRFISSRIKRMQIKADGTIVHMK
jgi:hypothetical protein